MSAGRLSTCCTHAAIALILAGLVLSVFAGAHGAGLVVAILGLIAYGGSLVSLYLAWEYDE